MQNKFTGLTDEQVAASKVRHGDNRLIYKTENNFFKAIKSLAKEPMVLLLFAAAAIYFVSGKTGDGVFMAAAIVLVAGISLYQDSRSRNALAQLKKFTQPGCRVIRNGEVVEISSDDIVTGDFLMTEEGTTIAADGRIVQANDFSVNESILTGESLPLFKSPSGEDNLIFRGATVVSGLAIAEVIAVGNATRLGKIGKSLEGIEEEPTPLELQIGNFVKKMVIAGVLVFVVVWAINYVKSGVFTDSLLKSLTLAMSILPEEIPVAFTTFMALGAWRLMKMGIVVKQMKTVETLGSATVICTDKTGTITENRMSVAGVYVFDNQVFAAEVTSFGEQEKSVVRIAMFASEPVPFDPMETALHEVYSQVFPADERPDFDFIHEYPLSGKPPMMTHIFENSEGVRIIAAKGAPEAIIQVSALDAAAQQQVDEAVSTFAAKGYRVLGVAEGIASGDPFPEEQQAIKFRFKGLVAFYDPPKENIGAVLEQFYNAGIAVKIITGDNAATTGAIARQIGFRGHEKSISGDEIMNLTDGELEAKAVEMMVFTRMFPDAKLRIINALKARHEIVAMTGDGVNDGPALKAAHIGIAMGRKGTEIAKQAASLVLAEDDLAKMVDAVAMGRKIYTNLKKAIQYIISIHIPIILTVFLPLALGWVYPNIFSPVHIIFLELIMGPTCSIIYENEPMEPNAMSQPPRPFTTTFFNWKELSTSILQGLVITAGALGVYQYAAGQGWDEQLVRSMVFTTLIAANIFLTLSNRSFYYSILTTLRYRNNLVPLMIGITILITGLLLYIPVLSRFFEFSPLHLRQIAICVAAGLISVIWFEVWKLQSSISNSHTSLLE